MTWLITSDLHLTDRPEHSYRIEFLAWLRSAAQNEGATAVLILGDISDQKDRHSSVLVNAIDEHIRAIAEVADVHILYGNHDGPSQDRPFWKFLGGVYGGADSFCNVHYYVHGTLADVRIGDTPHKTLRVYMAPWGAENGAIAELNRSPTPRGDIRYVFLHATVSGAVAENGMPLEGSCPAKLAPPGWKGKIYSGDVHVPQVIGDVEYVGSPYHVHYGDGFTPRVIVLDPATGRHHDIEYGDAPRLYTLHLDVDSDALPGRIRAGDRVKIVATANRSILPSDWQTYVKTMRTKVEGLGAEFSTALLENKAPAEKAAPSIRRSDEAIVRTFAATMKYGDDVTEVGVALVKP